MVEELPDDVKHFPFSFYFDLFTSFSLLSYLRLKGYGGTGSIRENRLPRGCPLLGKKVLQKKERGYFENIISRTDGVLVAKWVDNSVVSPSSSSSPTNVANQVRFDRLDHLIEKIPDNKRRCCAGETCLSSTRTQCRKCNIGLCIDCFFKYHTTNFINHYKIPICCRLK